MKSTHDGIPLTLSPNSSSEGDLKDATSTPSTVVYPPLTDWQQPPDGLLLLIRHDPDIANGEPILSGTRLRVAILYSLHVQAGLSVDELAGEYPHLSRAQIKSALDYALANSDKMEEYLAEDENA